MLSGKDKDAKDGNDGKDAMTVSSEEWAQLRQERHRNKTSLDLMASQLAVESSILKPVPGNSASGRWKPCKHRLTTQNRLILQNISNASNPEPDANTENAKNSPEFLLIFWDNKDHRRSSLYCLCISKLLKSMGSKVESARKQVEQLDEVKQWSRRVTPPSK